MKLLLPLCEESANHRISNTRSNSFISIPPVHTHWPPPNRGKPCDEVSWSWLCSSLPDSMFIVSTLLAWNEFWWYKYTKYTMEPGKGYRSVLPSPQGPVSTFLPACYWITNRYRGHCETISYQRLVTMSLLDFLCLTSSESVTRNLFFKNITFTVLLAQSVFNSLCYMLFFHIFKFSAAVWCYFWIHDGYLYYLPI